MHFIRKKCPICRRGISTLDELRMEDRSYIQSSSTQRKETQNLHKHNDDSGYLVNNRRRVHALRGLCFGELLNFVTDQKTC
jgi:hypothetical protein